MKGKIKLKDVLYYLQGHIRYRIYYSRFKRLLIRKHIRDQIDYRLEVMNPECYDKGSCIECGCTTTQLQMCNKACEGRCYPILFDKVNWNKYKRYKWPYNV